MEVFALKVLKKEKIIKEHQVEHTNTERKVLTEIDNPFKFQFFIFWLSRN